MGLAIDAPSGEVWLIDWPEDAVLLSPMCSHHADALTVPAGWLLHDNRGDTNPALFADRSVARAKPIAMVTALAPQRAKGHEVVESQTLFDETLGAETDVDPNSLAASSTRPRNRGLIGKPEDRHSKMLDVDNSTPLLERAFRSSQAS